MLRGAAADDSALSGRRDSSCQAIESLAPPSGWSCTDQGARNTARRNPWRAPPDRATWAAGTAACRSCPACGGRNRRCGGAGSCRQPIALEIVAQPGRRAGCSCHGSGLGRQPATPNCEGFPLRFSTWSFVGSAYRSAKSRACSAWSCRIGRWDGGVPIISGLQKKSAACVGTDRAFRDDITRADVGNRSVDTKRRYRKLVGGKQLIASSFPSLRPRFRPASSFPSRFRPTSEIALSIQSVGIESSSVENN